MDPRVLQAWWFERQGLMAPQEGASAAEVLARTGWARSVGGANPYLTLFARAGVSREAADRDLEVQALHELPSARGCTYLVPRDDYALALTVGQGTGDEAQVATARKFLGVTEAELERLAEKVLGALADGPLDPRDLKEAVGDAVRNLGAEGKKRGVTTTLPLSLGRLQSGGGSGGCRPMGGWISSAIATPSGVPRRWMATRSAARRRSPNLPAATSAGSARRRWRTSSGSRGWASRQRRRRWRRLVWSPWKKVPTCSSFPRTGRRSRSYRPPGEPRFALVASIDGITHLRRDVASLLAEEDRDHAMRGERGTLTLGGVQDLSSHPILDRGRLVGLWEFDPGRGEIAWSSFVSKTPALEAEVARTEAYVREQLGDARSFSLDSPESRQSRIEALRSAS